MTSALIKAVTVHALGIWALAYLYKDFCEDGVVDTLLGSDNTGGHKMVQDIIPRGVLHFDIGFLSGPVEALVATTYVAYLLTIVWRWINTPSESLHDYRLRDRGHHIPPGIDKKEASQYIQQVRKVGDIPPPYPNGWYKVMRSCDLPRNSVRAVSLVGENFAVFRNEEGKVFIVDAYCPHLGANLGVGGHVRGNCIECPFHGWQFDGETGQCVNIPYTDKPIPKSAKTKVWPSTECHNLIFVWYDAEGRDPLFPLEEVGEVQSGQWKYKGWTVHYAATHIEDISENGSDMLHLDCVHGANVSTGASHGYDEGWLSRLLVHNWKGNWEPLTDKSHVGCMTINLTHTFLGMKIPFLNVSVMTHQIGPSVVILRYKTAFGSGVWVETIVPEGPLYQRIATYAYANWWMPSVVASMLLEGLGTQLDRDVNIWASKTYRLKPLYVTEDKILIQHRKWFQQFYSEGSKKFTIKRDNDLTW